MTITDETHEKMVEEEFTEEESHTEDEHFVSVAANLNPGSVTLICTCGRLRQDMGHNPSMRELTNAMSAHLVPGLTV